MGALLGAAAWLFAHSLAHLPPLARNKSRSIVRFIMVFALIGLLAMRYPDILGNGKAGNQLSFIGALSGNEALGLLLAK